MNDKKVYAGHRNAEYGGKIYSAEVTLTAIPTQDETTVIVSDSVYTKLQMVFGDKTDQVVKHFISATIHVSLSWANVAGEMPKVAATKFQVVIVSAKFSEVDLEIVKQLIGIAILEAFGDYLQDFNQSRR
jgi:hypothetical protein